MSLLTVARNPDWIGCIDFGTALSKVALTRRMPRSGLTEKDIVALAIGVRDGVATPNPFLLPSIVYVTDQGFLFGLEAQAAAVRNERLGRQAFASPKQYLSTHEPEQLDEPLEHDIDPTRTYTPRILLALFLAHLLVQAGRAAAAAGVPWPVPLRIARPAWAASRAAAGEKNLRSLVLQAFAIADALGDRLSATKGLTHKEARSTLAKVMSNEHFHNPAAYARLFELSTRGSSSVLEATAVAAGSIRETGRRVIAVADIGGGTSDFGAFMTGLPGRDALAEIKGSSRILREAGDHLDMLLTRYILNRAGIDRDDPAGRGIANRLRARQRETKQVLFAEGRVTVEIGDDFQTVTQEDFLKDPLTEAFTQRLRTAFGQTLTFAVECARQYSLNGGRTPVEILLTGGGNGLPMVRDLVNNPPVRWHYLAASPELPNGPVHNDFLAVRRQLAVAIGGAVRDLPRETAAIRLWPTGAQWQPKTVEVLEPPPRTPRS